MTDLSSLDQTLDSIRAELSPSAADKERNRIALGLGPRSTNAFAAGSRTLVPSSWRALRASGAAGLLSAALLAGVNFSAGYWLGRKQPAAARPSSVPDDRATRTPSVTSPQQDATPVAAIPADSVPPPAAPSAKKSTRGPARDARPRAQKAEPAAELNGELALLRRVERALRAADAALALALIQELDERFAETALGEERQAARVMAHCGLSDPGARLRAERFLRDHAASVYTERVRSACALAHSSEGSLGGGDE